MATAYIIGGAIMGAIVAGVTGVVTGLAQDELKGWIGRLPFWLLRIATKRVPEDIRDSLREDWEAELHHLLRDKTDRPITRLVVGLRFSLGLVSGGAKAADEITYLHGRRDPLQLYLNLEVIYNGRSGLRLYVDRRTRHVYKVGGPSDDGTIEGDVALICRGLPPIGRLHPKEPVIHRLDEGTLRRRLHDFNRWSKWWFQKGREPKNLI